MALATPIRGYSRGLVVAARAGAFTVPEILAVVAIILIIISLLMPSLGQSREAARSAVCQSQLHQHMVAARTYCADQQRMLRPRT